MLSNIIINVYKTIAIIKRQSKSFNFYPILVLAPNLVIKINNQLVKLCLKAWNNIIININFYLLSLNKSKTTIQIIVELKWKKNIFIESLTK